VHEQEYYIVEYNQWACEYLQEFIVSSLLTKLLDMRYDHFRKDIVN